MFSALISRANNLFQLDDLQKSHGVDVRAETLKSLDVTYLTPRIIAMGFPSTPQTKIRSRNDAAAVATLLREAHGGGHVCVWNLAEEGYDYALFDNQVVEVSFPGFPAPPLGLMTKICAGVESWLAADPSHVAAIHCMTGRGRTAVVCACVLAWLGLADSPLTALDLVAEKRGRSDADALCVPSQTRYCGYFGAILEGVRPRQPGAAGEGGGSTEELRAAAAAAEAAAAGTAAADQEIMGSAYVGVGSGVEGEEGGGLGALLLAPPPPPPPAVACVLLRRLVLHGVPDLRMSVEQWRVANGKGGEGDDGEGGEGGSRKPLGPPSSTALLAARFARVAAGIDQYLITPVLGPADDDSESEDDGIRADGETKEHREARLAAREASRKARLARRAEAAAAAAAAGEGSPDEGGAAAAAAGAPQPEGVDAAGLLNVALLKGGKLFSQSTREATEDAVEKALHQAEDVLVQAEVIAARAEARIDSALHAAFGRLSTAVTGVSGAASVVIDSAAAAVSSTAAAAGGEGEAGGRGITPAVGGELAPAAASTAEANPTLDAAAATAAAMSREPGCRLLLQLYANGVLAWSSGSSSGGGGGGGDDDGGFGSMYLEAEEGDASYGGSSSRAAGSGGGGGTYSVQNLPWLLSCDGEAIVPVNQAVAGDVLMRVRYVPDGSSSVSSGVTLFRAAFHTGFVPGNVLRLSKRQLDLPGPDPRIPSDFWVEVVFGSPEQEAEQAEAHALLTGGGEPGGGSPIPLLVPTAGTSPYDAQFGEVSFWEGIELRRKSREAARLERVASAAAAAATAGVAASVASAAAVATATAAAAAGVIAPAPNVAAVSLAPAPPARSSYFSGFTAALSSAAASSLSLASNFANAPATSPSSAQSAPMVAAPKLAPPVVKPAATVPPAPAVATQLDADLAELEVLEQELSLAPAPTSAALPVATTSVMPAVAAAFQPTATPSASAAPVDEADDLERYISELTAPQ